MKAADDIISENPSDVMENQNFENGVASMVQNAIEDNHPPEDISEEAAALPIPNTNRTSIDGTFVDLNAGTTATTSLVSGEWCIPSVGTWNYYSGHGWFSEVNFPPSEWWNSCAQCPTAGSTRDHWSRVQTVTETDGAIGKVRVVYWNRCT